MEYTKLKFINQYKSESINPAKTPDTVFEMYSVPIYETGHPEFLRGDEIASNKAVVQKNDILLCKINPRINRVWVVSDESDKMNIASSEWIVIRNSEYNPEFLAWYFRTPKFQKLMTSEVTGIGGSLTRAQPKCVAEYPVPVLDRVKQDEIVAILNKCKFVIESRKQELDALDDLIKARFVELFGDVKRNAFSWQKCTFDDVTTKITDGEHGTVPRVEEGEGYLYFMARNITKDGLIDLSETSYVPEEVHQKIYKRCNPELGDILLVCVGATIGKSTLVTEELGEFSMARSVALLKPNIEKVNSIFLINLLKSDAIQNDISNCAHAAAQAGLYTNMIKSLDAFVPPIELQNQFADFVKQVDKSKVAVQKSLDETQQLFDSLMQQYFG